MKRIAVFASGNGSNAQRIAEYFNSRADIEVGLILSNKKDAYVLKRAKNLGIPTHIFNREDLYRSRNVLKKLREYSIDFIVLAGFLWLLPDEILHAYPDRIVNIHPALLPKFGGKGMYGSRVHEAVLASGETETGITIHYVNEHYDEGQIIFQERFPIRKGDTPESIAAKVHELEYKHYPVLIEALVEGL
ncbi:MAG: phosphoribosylglycinamide formyltransferase [Bacteroidales bacterium]